MAGGGITDGVGIMAGDGDITVGAGVDMAGVGVDMAGAGVIAITLSRNGLILRSGYCA